MFLSAFQTYVVFIIIPIVMVQYAFAIYCLLKLAYMNLSKNRYILWNLFILIVFFIGGTVFLVYYFKHPELRIPKTAPAVENAEEQTQQTQGDTAEQKDESAEETSATDTDDTENS